MWHLVIIAELKSAINGFQLQLNGPLCQKSVAPRFLVDPESISLTVLGKRIIPYLWVRSQYY
jgi:hypothetical protein